MYESYNTIIKTPGTLSICRVAQMYQVYTSGPIREVERSSNKSLGRGNWLSHSCAGQITVCAWTMNVMRCSGNARWAWCAVICHCDHSATFRVNERVATVGGSPGISGTGHLVMKWMQRYHNGVRYVSACMMYDLCMAFMHQAPSPALVLLE